MINKAREAARLTPPARNRAADFYRTIAICFVVLGHWSLVAPYIPQGEMELRNILAEQPRTQYLTWLFQVMPVFFFVGGFSNAASWTSARQNQERRSYWATGRLRRLLVPVIPLIIFWALAAVVAYSLEVDSALARAASQAALIPVWFLAVYIMVTLAVPISYTVWERLGLWSVAMLAGLAIVIDLVGIGLEQSWLRWANYAPVWLAVHQLGYWWWRGDHGLRGLVGLCVLGIVWMAVLIGPAGYPLSMVSVPGEAFSNTRPPTTAMLALGAVQISLLLLLEKPVRAWLQRETPWAMVILVARSIMTIYLWHLTVVIAVAGLSLALRGFGLRTEPGTAAWWALRPIWIAALTVGLIPLVAVFGHFESGSRAGGEPRVGTVQASLGALMSCAGLTLLALNGATLDHFPGVNWVPVVLIVLGVFVATKWSMQGMRK